MQLQEADHIGIPLLDGSYLRAQVVRADSGTALIYLTGNRIRQGETPGPLDADAVLSALLVNVADLPDAHWPVFGYDRPPHITRKPAWPPSDSDHPIHDAAIIEAFANALVGLYPWDGFPDRDFFTSLLIEAEAIPASAIFTADLPRPDTSTPST